MATITVKDSTGATVAVEKPLGPGRAAAAASKPVVLSTEDLAALQAVSTALATMLTALQGTLDVDGSGHTQPVSASALPLPTGAATEASLAAMKGADITSPSPSMPAGGSGVLGWLSAIWTKLNASLAVTGTFWQATQPVSGPLTDTQMRATAVPVSASALPLPAGASSSAKQPSLGTAGTASADVISVQGIASMTALKVDGSAATQPIAFAGATLVDRSGTIATGGTQQTLMAANSSRRGAAIQNNSTGDLWINSLANAVIGQPSIKIAPGLLWEYSAVGVPLTAISIIGATTSQAFSAREW